MLPFPWELVIIWEYNQYYVFLKVPPWHLSSSFSSAYIFSNLNNVRSCLQDFFVHSVGGTGLQQITASLYALNHTGRTVRCDFKVWEDTTLIVFFAFRLIGPVKCRQGNWEWGIMGVCDLFLGDIYDHFFLFRDASFASITQMHIKAVFSLEVHLLYPWFTSDFFCCWIFFLCVKYIAM